MFERICPICGAKHLVRQSNHKYCKNHTEKERKRFYERSDVGRRARHEARKAYWEKHPDEKARRLKMLKEKYPKRRSRRKQEDAICNLCRTCPIWEGCRRKRWGCTTSQRSIYIKRAGLLPPPDRERSVTPLPRGYAHDHPTGRGISTERMR